MNRFKVVVLALILINAVACSGGGPTYQPPAEDPVPSEIVNWLQTNAVPFDTAQPGVDYTDLMPLKDMVGNARIVSLGEATHGTREFFQMKHRVLEFLVKEMDFNVFAIEATWSEANRINDYVHTGQGDPEVLLSGLYFYSWNTEEVLEMIRWMREHNQNPGDHPTVSFLGFDMQFPGMAIHNVYVFLQAVDASAVSFVSERYDCMSLYANSPTGWSGWPVSRKRYDDQSAAYRDSCRADLLEVYDFLVQHQAEYEAASSVQEFAQALQSARIVLQYEDMESQRTPGARDFYMAENAIWLLDQAGPDDKMVLWAHNLHVADDPAYSGGGSMGHHLRGAYGDDMVIVGFDFYQGEFRAGTIYANGSRGPWDVHSVGVPPKFSYEYYFHSAGLERLILDLRGVNMETPATSWLAGPRNMRWIGSGFWTNSPERHFTRISLPSHYDLVIYFDYTQAAVGLPFRYPNDWWPYQLKTAPDLTMDLSPSHSSTPDTKIATSLNNKGSAPAYLIGTVTSDYRFSSNGARNYRQANYSFVTNLLKSIGKRKLFGDYRLKGTIVYDAVPELSRSIVEDLNTGKSRIYSINEKLPDKSIIVGIKPEHITLQKSGVRRKICFPSEGNIGGSKRSTLLEDSFNGFKEINDNEYDLKMYQVFKGDASSILDFSMEVYSQNGQKDGIQISDIEHNALALDLGLQENDVLLAVNNESVNSLLGCIKVCINAYSSDELQLKIRRGDDVILLTYHLFWEGKGVWTPKDVLNSRALSSLFNNALTAGLF